MKKTLFITLASLSAAIFAQNAIVNDTIGLTINEQNTICIKAVFNETDTLNLNFDSGTTELVLTNDVLKNKLKSEVKLYNTFYNVKIGNRDYKTKVYDAELSGHGTDGRFGWDFFKNKVLEINYDKNILVVHSKLPNHVLNNYTYTKVNIRYFKDVFLIESTLSQNGVNVTGDFLFDTGYQRTVMLDNDLLKADSFPIEKTEEIKKSIMKGAQGNEIPVVISNLEILKIGNCELKNIPIQQIIANKPMKGHNIHILGNEILKKFNTFLDFQNNVVYLKPNKLFNIEYIEKKKNG